MLLQVQLISKIVTKAFSAPELEMGDRAGGANGGMGFDNMVDCIVPKETTEMALVGFADSTPVLFQVHRIEDEVIKSQNAVANFEIEVAT